jgi:hypothetical protein
MRSAVGGSIASSRHRVSSRSIIDSISPSASPATWSRNHSVSISASEIVASRNPNRARISAQALGGSSGEKCLAVHRNRDVELPAQRRDPLRLDFGLVPWKPAAITEKRQQDRKTKPVRVMLIHHQGMIVWCQCPLIIRANDWLHHVLEFWSSLTQFR